MRATFLLALVLVTGLGAVDRAPDTRALAAAPCTTATPKCEAWVVFGKGPARTMVYASYPLNARNDAIRRALIMVHGTNRNADHYFDTAMAATFLAGALDDT